jgi:hypothetical protein
MKGGEISGNTAGGAGGGVRTLDKGTFIMEGGAIWGNTGQYSGGIGIGGTFTLKGGRIQGSTDSDGFAKNTATTGWANSGNDDGTTVLKRGTGGTYTIGGVPQTGGSDILNADGRRGTNDTLIATPAL